MEETVRAFNHLINTGKAFYWGTSEWNADEISEAWRVAEQYNLIGPLMEQPHYNLLVREKVEKEYLGVIERHGLGLTIFSPLRQGILTGKYNEEIPEDSRLEASQDQFSKNMKERYGDEDWVKQIKQVKALKVSLNFPGVLVLLGEWLIESFPCSRSRTSSAVTRRR